MSAPVQDPELVEKEVAPNLATIDASSFDVQVATAKKFPRSITTFVRRAKEMATLNEDVAASCVYALPRDGKTIEGPSARLAEIIASAWGNLRIQAGVKDHDDRFVTGRGEAWDVETNVAIAFEVRRRITNKNGKTYNDDMITMTGNGAASIALRNAVFKAVPSPYWRPIYLECRKVIAGDARTFASRRDEMLRLFMVMGVTVERVYEALGLKGVSDITLEHMVTLTGFYNALKEGETTIEEAFPEGGGLGTPQPAQRKSQQAAAPATTSAGGDPGPQQHEARSREMPSAAAGQVSGPVSPPSTTAPKHIGVIDAVTDKGNGAFVIRLKTGFKCSTRDAALMTAAAAYRDRGVTVELATRPSSDPAKYAPVLEEILLVDEGQTS
jgi:hypothetical protein